MRLMCKTIGKKIFALLGCNTTLTGSYLQIFQDKQLVKGLAVWPSDFKMGPTP